MTPSVEFLYQNKKYETLVLIWNGQNLLDKRTINGVISPYKKRKIKKDIIKEYKEKK